MLWRYPGLYSHISESSDHDSRFTQRQASDRKISRRDRMNCFNHPDRLALGACKHCCKGVCNDCITDTGVGIACKGSCEDHVRAIDRLMGFSNKVASRGISNTLILPIMMLSMGAVFFIYGLNKYDDFFHFTTIFGALFLILGVISGVSLYKSRREVARHSDDA